MTPPDFDDLPPELDGLAAILRPMCSAEFLAKLDAALAQRDHEDEQGPPHTPNRPG